MAQRKLDRISDDDLYAQWSQWVRDDIYYELLYLGSRQQIFDLIGKLTEDNERLRQTGGHVLNWMYENYVAAVAMTLRRELDDQKVANIRHLLHEMEARPQVMTRQRYRALWKEPDRFDALWGPDRDFERYQLVRHVDDPARDHVASTEFRADREELIRETALVHEFIEQTIAHRSGKEQPKVTLRQVHVAVEATVEVFKKYYTLFTASSLATHRPEMQFDTYECFTFRWWTPEWHAWGDMSCEVHHVAVLVKDVSRATAWYRDVLDFRVGGDVPRAVEIQRRLG